MSQKLKVAVIGATGMVGQRFIAILDNHPWFEVTELASQSYWPEGNLVAFKIPSFRHLNKVERLICNNFITSFAFTH